MSFVDRIVQRHPLPFPPRQYQRREIDLRIEDCMDKVGLYWGVGAGKTLGATLHALIHREEIGSQALLVVPPILVEQWYRWLNRVKGVTAKVYYGTPAQRKKVVFDHDTTFFITSIQILKRDFAYLMDKLGRRPLLVVVDEATAIKNYDSDNFRAVLQMQNGQALSLLTGTPLSTPKDAYAYIKLLAPGTYRDYKQFESIHVKKTDFFGAPTAWRELDLLQQNMGIHTSTLRTADVLPEMPRAIYSEVPYKLDSKHMKLYHTLVDQQLLLYEDGSMIDASTPGKLQAAVQQIVMNYGYFAQNPGLKAVGYDVLDECLSEVGPGGKIVIYANYKMTIRSIMAYLAEAGIGAVQINGEVSNTQKFKNVDRFREDPKCRAIVMNPLSGGVGVDGLQEVCNYMLFLELPSISKDFQQAVGRLERGGQTMPPVVKIATAEGTVQVTLRNNLLDNSGLVNQIHLSYRDLRAALYGEG